MSALHIRRRRQWYGARPITQEELATLSGASYRQVRRFEELKRLPKEVDLLLRFAVALEVSLEALLDPRRVREVYRDVERRRTEHRRRAEPDAV